MKKLIVLSSLLFLILSCRKQNMESCKSIAGASNKLSTVPKEESKIYYKGRYTKNLEGYSAFVEKMAELGVVPIFIDTIRFPYGITYFRYVFEHDFEIKFIANEPDLQHVTAEISSSNFYTVGSSFELQVGQKLKVSQTLEKYKYSCFDENFEPCSDKLGTANISLFQEPAYYSFQLAIEEDLIGCRLEIQLADFDRIKNIAQRCFSVIQH